MFLRIQEVEAAPVKAVPCTFEWDPSPDNTVAGYALYCSAVGSSVTNRFDAGNATTITVINLDTDAKYSFYVVAYNASGVESIPSNVLSYSPPGMSHFQAAKAADGTMKLQFRVASSAPCRVEFTPTLNPPQWQTLSTAYSDIYGNVSIVDPLTGNPAARFYRVVGP